MPRFRRPGPVHINFTGPGGETQIVASGLAPDGMAQASAQLALIVDDDPAARKIVHRYLRSLGLSVLEASDASSALRHLRELTPALICLDVTLPELSGFAVCEQIRNTAHLQQTPVLMISSRTLPEYRALAEEVGASSYLIRPFTLAEFAQEVRTLLHPKANGAP